MKIKINLLPPEIKAQAQEKSKKSLIVKISVVILLIMIFGTGSLISAVLIQSQNLQKNQRDLDQAKSDLKSFEPQEGLLLRLANRINGINKLSQEPSPQADAFNLITKLMPPGISINTFTISRNNELVIGGETSSTKLLETFFNNLTDPKINDGNIGTVEVDTLSRAQNGSLRFDLTISLTSIKLSKT